MLIKTTLVYLDGLVRNTTKGTSLGIGIDIRIASLPQGRCYCEKTDNELVVEVVVIVRFRSVVLIIPASSFTWLKLKSFVGSVTAYVAVGPRFPVGVILEPVTEYCVPPYVSIL